MLLVCSLACIGIVAGAGAAPVNLGEAESFAVLGASGVTNSGETRLVGDLGSHPTGSIGGFPPGTYTGSLHEADETAEQAQSDASTAYNTLEGLEFDEDMTADPLLGGKTLESNVYNFDSTADLTETLTLDGPGDYVFQMGSTLTTATDSSIDFINGADPYDVFWQVGSSATLGTRTDFGGTIIASESNTLNTGATVDGRVIALNQAVTLDNNTVVVPEPGSLTLLVAALGGLALFCRRRTA